MTTENAKYTTLQIKNTGGANLTVSITDPDGQEHSALTLEAGASATLLTPLNASWTLKIGDAGAASRSTPESAGAFDLDESGGKGGMGRTG